jgi:hypothetical protein
MHALRPPRPLAAALLLLCATAAPSLAEVKGRAYGCWANMPSYGIGDVTQCDSGWLDRMNGGSRSSYKSNVSYGNTLHVDSMESESHGDRCRGHSGSKVEAGWIGKGMPWEVTWTHMESADEDTCCKPEDVDDRPSIFVGLTFGGRPVNVTGRPNQTIFLTGQATLILNETRHEQDNDCDDDNLEHRALHLILSRGDEVILACAKFDSDDDCCMAAPVHRSRWGEVKSHYR